MRWEVWIREVKVERLKARQGSSLRLAPDDLCSLGRATAKAKQLPQVFCTVCTDPKTLLQPLHGLADLVLGTHCLVPLLEGLQRLFRGVAVLLQPIQEHPAAN